jgi:hypothetical protein
LLVSGANCGLNFRAGWLLTVERSSYEPSFRRTVNLT